MPQNSGLLNLLPAHNREIGQLINHADVIKKLLVEALDKDKQIIDKYRVSSLKSTSRL